MLGSLHVLCQVNIDKGLRRLVGENIFNW
jgi:hypothetical protein